MKEISKEKTFYEMAETVFQERKEKLETLKKREKEEELKKRDERIKRIAIICLNIFSESTKHTQNSQDFVTQIYIEITFRDGMAIGSDCEIITSNSKSTILKIVAILLIINIWENIWLRYVVKT